jgi:2-oxoisovalerate dehydrogenase E1 component
MKRQGTKYVPQELMDLWAAKDPVENYRSFKEKQSLRMRLTLN